MEKQGKTDRRHHKHSPQGKEVTVYMSAIWDEQPLEVSSVTYTWCQAVITKQAAITSHC
jgi:hypothetical protein